MRNPGFELRRNALSFKTVNTLLPIVHLHRDIELVYVKRGYARCFADDTKYEISDGDIFLCFPNQIHYYLDTKEGEYYLLIFSPDVIYNLRNIFDESLPESNVFKAAHGSECAKLLDKIFEQREKYNVTVQVGLLNQIIPMILSGICLLPRIVAATQTIPNILSYCSRNFSQNISLDSAAKELHLNKYYISHLFNQKLGISFNYYINSLRISAACDLMKSSDNNLSYISEEVGFGSIRSFNRAFVQIMNTTPLKYRKDI